MNLPRRTGVNSVNSYTNTPIHRCKRRKFMPQYSHDTGVKVVKTACFTPKIYRQGVKQAAFAPIRKIKGVYKNKFTPYMDMHGVNPILPGEKISVQAYFLITSWSIIFPSRS